MDYKRKSIIFSILIIISIQILLLINNRQKTSFRYFIWNLDNVSIGRLICTSFISGVLISSILNKTIHNDAKTSPVNNDDDETIYNSDNYKNKDVINELDEIPPERDLRDPQPTISVNYRVIKDNAEIETKDRNQKSNWAEYNDDWNKNFSDW